MAEPRYSDERQQLLERLARGRCHAVMRKTDDFRSVCWRPCVADEVVGDEKFATKPEAVAAAKQFREQCRQQLAETNGSV
ncbi:hypothetical protein [Tardiphaga sp.]|jgi:hypothetical protein|uniref:hypothetical protein n=1 Tax=Tardiphaga sp. TaxID=1926292 RepID=UPI0037DA0DF5